MTKSKIDAIKFENLKSLKMRAVITGGVGSWKLSELYKKVEGVHEIDIRNNFYVKEIIEVIRSCTKVDLCSLSEENWAQLSSQMVSQKVNV